MRGCAGVLAGLFIGAAVGFCCLALVALVRGEGAACAQPEPSQWQIRAAVSQRVAEGVIGRQVALPWGAVTITGVEFRECGRAMIRARWESQRGWSLPDLGLELSLALVEDAGLRIRPATAWFGRLPVPLGWLGDGPLATAFGDLDEALAAALQERLGEQDLRLCQVGTAGGRLVVYLCPAGA